MPVPAQYTEETLAGYMHEVLGADEVARDLGWSTQEGDYDEAVLETAFAFGVDDVAEVTGRENVRRLRAIARRELWRLVMQRTAHFHGTQASVEGGGESRNQIHEHARRMFELAAAEAPGRAETATVAPPAGGALRNVYRPWS